VLKEFDGVYLSPEQHTSITNLYQTKEKIEKGTEGASDVIKAAAKERIKQIDEQCLLEAGITLTEKEQAEYSKLKSSEAKLNEVRKNKA